MKASTPSFQIGYISRTHGVRGAVILTLEDLEPKEFKNMEFVFLELEGIRIPFFVSEYRPRNSYSAVLTLADINTDEEANQLIACKAYAEHKAQRASHVATNDSNSQIIGYTAYDSKLGLLGEVLDYHIIPGNNLWEIQTSENPEILVPAHTDFIDKINHQTKEIHFTLPDMLLDL